MPPHAADAWPSHASAGRRRFFLREDVSIECYTSDEHARLVGLMWILVLIWPVGGKKKGFAPPPPGPPPTSNLHPAVRRHGWVHG